MAIQTCVLKSRTAFFRSGPGGRAEDVLSTDQLDQSKRVAELASPELLSWIDHAAANQISTEA